tara:strand:+ start:207 stop:389 length:183 start_codon:yes stop_codon:yes gene_type:complete
MTKDQEIYGAYLELSTAIALLKDFAKQDFRVRNEALLESVLPRLYLVKDMLSAERGNQND